MSLKTNTVLKDEPVSQEVGNDEFELMFLQESGGEPEAVAEPLETTAEVPEVEEPKVEEPEPKVEELKVEVPKVEDPEPKVVEPKLKVVEPKVEDPAAVAAREAQDAKNAERTKRAQLAEDEQALMAEVKKDFPDIARVQDIQQRIIEARVEAALDERFAAMEKRYAPALDTAQVVAKNEFERKVLKTHEDAFAILPEVEKWIETQPTILKNAYNAVLDNGTAADAVELLTLFKDAAGRSKVEDDPAKLEAARKVEEERERKLASQEGVKGRQTTKKDSAPETFDGAFEQASKALA